MQQTIANPHDNQTATLGWFKVMVAGVISGLIAVTFASAGASLIFSGNLLRFLPTGMAITLASSALLILVVGLMSRIRGAIACRRMSRLPVLLPLPGRPLHHCRFRQPDLSVWQR